MSFDLVYRALSDPTRRRVLELLRERDHTAGELAAHFECAKSTLSGHLSTLKHADLVDVTRRGTTLTYRLNLSLLEGALVALADTFQLKENPS